MSSAFAASHHFQNRIRFLSDLYAELADPTAAAQQSVEEVAIETE